MRIILLSVDDEFAGLMQKYLFAEYPSWIVSSVISTTPIYKKNKISGIFFIIKKSGFYYLFQMVRMKIFRKIFGREVKITPSKLAKLYKTEIFRTKNINEKRSLDYLENLKPDIIISTNFSHYIGAKVRKIAKYGVWNLHKSYLPFYRGMAPNFYALLNGEKEIGATLHIVDSGFDTGAILCQNKIATVSSDTVYSLNIKTADLGGRMLANYLKNCDLNNIIIHEQPTGNLQNFSYPSRKDIKNFKKAGLYFDKL